MEVGTFSKLKGDLFASGACAGALPKSSLSHATRSCCCIARTSLFNEQTWLQNTRRIRACDRQTYSVATDSGMRSAGCPCSKGEKHKEHR